MSSLCERSVSEIQIQNLISEPLRTANSAWSGRRACIIGSERQSFLYSRESLFKLIRLHIKINFQQTSKLNKPINARLGVRTFQPLRAQSGLYYSHYSPLYRESERFGGVRQFAESLQQTSRRVSRPIGAGRFYTHCRVYIAQSTLWRWRSTQIIVITVRLLIFNY